MDPRTRVDQLVNRARTLTGGPYQNRNVERMFLILLDEHLHTLEAHLDLLVAQDIQNRDIVFAAMNTHRTEYKHEEV